MYVIIPEYVLLSLLITKKKCLKTKQDNRHCITSLDKPYKIRKPTVIRLSERVTNLLSHR